MNEKLLAVKKELQCRNRVLVHLYDTETGDLLLAHLPWFSFTLGHWCLLV